MLVEGTLDVAVANNFWFNDGTLTSPAARGRVGSDEIQNLGTIRGYGLVDARVVNHGTIRGTDGQILHIKAKDLDGAQEDGEVYAVDGDIEVLIGEFEQGLQWLDADR
jgi:hypothetical protein